jgi:hypothetical protein
MAADDVWDAKFVGVYVEATDTGLEVFLLTDDPEHPILRQGLGGLDWYVFDGGGMTLAAPMGREKPDEAASAAAWDRAFERVNDHRRHQARQRVMAEHPDLWLV